MYIRGTANWYRNSFFFFLIFTIGVAVFKSHLPQRYVFTIDNAWDWWKQSWYKIHSYEASVRSKTSNKKNMLKCNYRCSMLSTDYTTIVHLTSFNYLITLGNTSAEYKGLERTIAYNNIQSWFPNHVFLYQLWWKSPMFTFSKQLS